MSVRLGLNSLLVWAVRRSITSASETRCRLTRSDCLQFPETFLVFHISGFDPNSFCSSIETSNFTLNHFFCTLVSSYLMLFISYFPISYQIHLELYPCMMQCSNSFLLSSATFLRGMNAIHGCLFYRPINSIRLSSWQTQLILLSNKQSLTNQQSPFSFMSSFFIQTSFLQVFGRADFPCRILPFSSSLQTNRTQNEDDITQSNAVLVLLALSAQSLQTLSHVQSLLQFTSSGLLN